MLNKTVKSCVLFSLFVALTFGAATPAAAPMNDDCPICMECLAGKDDVEMIPGCNHAYCRDCIRPWIDDHRNCPLCRGHATLAGLQNVRVGEARPWPAHIPHWRSVDEWPSHPRYKKADHVFDQEFSRTLENHRNDCKYNRGPCEIAIGDYNYHLTTGLQQFGDTHRVRQLRRSLPDGWYQWRAVDVENHSNIYVYDLDKQLEIETQYKSGAENYMDENGYTYDFVGMKQTRRQRGVRYQPTRNLERITGYQWRAVDVENPNNIHIYDENKQNEIERKFQTNPDTAYDDGTFTYNFQTMKQNKNSDRYRERNMERVPKEGFDRDAL